MDDCTPTVIYSILAILRIVIATFSGNIGSAAFQIVIALICVFILNLLCQNDLTIIAWLIVLVPLFI